MKNVSPNKNELEQNGSTPMLKQYHSIKEKHKDCVLFFRLGDFYEMFFDDAKAVSKELDLVLTSRGKTPSGRIPMCGFPHHAADNYISKLVKSGYKIAICEQTEDPALAKGLVKRDIIRIITSGTFLDENDSNARYIMALNPDSKTIGVSFTDPSNGTIKTNQYPLDKNKITQLISRLQVYECIFPESKEKEIKELFLTPSIKSKNISLSPYSDWCFNPDIARKSLSEHFVIHNMNCFGIENLPYAVASTGALLEYLREMNKQPLRHIDKVSLFFDDEYVFISSAANRGLELDNLIKTIDYTITSIGKRCFRFWIYHPLKNIDQIKQRQNAVTILKDNLIIKDLKFLLNKIPDLEKNISRLSSGYTHAKDLLAIRNTLNLIPQFKKLVDPLSEQNKLFSLKDIPELRQLLTRFINEDIPLSNPEGKVIAKGYDAELDSLKDIQENGREWLKKTQEKEIKRTGINSLKIGFNKVFGYYIEVTNTNLKNVPQDYIRKQTLVNAERFITEELKQYEETILNAQQKIIKIEDRIINDIQKKILDNSINLHDFCDSIAAIDCVYSLSILASQKNYCLPQISNDLIIDIKEGRHPVVEQILSGSFTPNNTLLDNEENNLIILTGPNMAGKSTYIRQTAILVIMAQSGSYIPAQSASIGIVDKIFTRIGAHDDIGKGQSTFMVEMNEAADILNNLTERSLIILDEIGRGTSTYDGLSLAWALAEHLCIEKPRTLFATHFHELTALAQEFQGVKNYNVAVKEWKDEIIFLHKIVPGGTDDSYGIYVAKLAGIPNNVIKKAREILSKLELNENIKESLSKKINRDSQLTFFSRNGNPIAESKIQELKDSIEDIDINNLTPIEALNKLNELKKIIEE